MRDISKERITAWGYVEVYDYAKKKTVFLHRWVWEQRYGEIPKGMQINHLNGIKTDNRIENLECVTPRENMKHAIKLGTWIPNRRKLTDEEVLNIRKMYKPRVYGLQKLADEFNMTTAGIHYVIHDSQSCRET